MSTEAELLNLKEHDLLEMLNGSKEEQLKTLMTIINETRAYAQQYITSWSRYRRKYRRGLRYLTSDDTRSTPLFFTNMIFSTVESVKANLTRALPSIVLRPMEEGDETAADVMGKILSFSMTRGGLMSAMESVVFHACITGTGWFKAWFDPGAYFGLGDNVIEAVAPENLLIDPIAINYKDARWFIHVHEDVPIEAIKAAHGKYPDSVDNGGDVHRDTSYGAKTKPSIGKTVTVYEVWVRDWGMEPVIDEKTQEVKKEGREPGWLIFVIAGNSILEKKTSPYQHGKSPFVPFYIAKDDGADDAYQVGIGEIEEIEPLQDKMDWMDKSIQKNISMTINRQKFVNPASGLNPKTMDNTPGRVYQVTGRPQDAVLWDNPPGLGMEVFGYRQNIEQQMQAVSGVFDVTQGRKPAGITAAKAIGSLQEAAAVRFYHKQKVLAESIREVAEICLENILQFYTEERVIRLQGGVTMRILGKYPDALAMPNPEEMAMMAQEPQPMMDEMGQPVVDPMTGQPVMQPPQSLEQMAMEIQTAREQFKQMNGINLVLEDIDFNFDITVDTDSPLPASKQERGQLAVDLFRLGALDRKGLLDALDWQDRDAILQRLEAMTTGKTAGQEGDILSQVVQMLTQAGMDPNMIEQMLMQMQQGGGQMPTSQQPENYGIMR